MIRYNGTKPISSRTGARASQPASTRPKKQSTWYAKLFAQQRLAADFILSRPATALFCKARTGKTYISMAVLERSKWCVALIIAPKTSLGAVWRPRLETLPNTVVLNSVQELAEALKTAGRHTRQYVVLSNPEALRSDARKLAKHPWDVVIIDESQSLKNRSSANSRIARRLRHVPRRIALSGTPIDKGQIDIWAQMRFVDHKVFGERWGDFAEEYCYKGGFKNKKFFFNDKKQSKFLNILRQHIFRLDDKFLGLKPIEIVETSAIMLGNHRKLYDEMLRNNLIYTGSAIIAGNNTGARDIKLSQITGGAVLDEEGNVHQVGKAKQRKLIHLLNKIEWPVVIFCQFLHEIEIIQHMLNGINVTSAVIRGSVREEDRTKVIKDFDLGKYDAIICQIRTGGEAIDLTRASTLILYSMSYSYINFEQLMRRIQGLNQKRVPKAYILVCEDSIDEDKLKLVTSKSETSEGVLAYFTKE